MIVEPETRTAERAVSEDKGKVIKVTPDSPSERKLKKRKGPTFYRAYANVSFMLGEGSRRLTCCGHHFLVDKKAEAQGS